jgi:hypothetical protein
MIIMASPPTNNTGWGGYFFRTYRATHATTTAAKINPVNEIASYNKWYDSSELLYHI